MKSKQYETWSKEELVHEINALRKQKTYGLVWEKDRTKEEFDFFINWEGEKTKEEFGRESKDKFPVLAEITSKEIVTNKNYPMNLLIEGDNYHSLVVLNFTHKGAIDVIYIDPPYNTGNKDFKYNDQFVEKEDGYRHSKWLSFISKRLVLAKNLLKDTGVIFISIDDNEQAQLRLLCDEIFGEENFLGNVIWQTATDNNPSQIAVEHEYIITYCKNKRLQPKWVVASEKARIVDTHYKELKLQFGNKSTKIQFELRRWMKENKDMLEGVLHYNYVDEKGVYYPDNPSNPHPGGYKYTILHPITKKPCRIPPNGYRWPEITFVDMLNKGDIEFGVDETITPKPKKRITNSKELLRSVYYEDNRRSTNELTELLGKKLFDNPKSPRLIKNLLRFVSNTEATVLDFFAGSGTTAHSVLEMNKEDGGHRRFIMCTNNESNICTEVCYPRIRNVIRGYLGASQIKVSGLGGNLKYFKTDFVEADPTDRNKQKLVNKCMEMLCIKENAFDSVKEGKRYRIFKNDEYHLGIIFDDDYIDDFVKEAQKIQNKFHVYVFSLDESVPTSQFKNLKGRMTLCAIPEAILKVYRKVFQDD